MNVEFESYCKRNSNRVINVFIKNDYFDFETNTIQIQTSLIQISKTIGIHSALFFIFLILSVRLSAQSITEDTLKIQEVQISAKRPIDERAVVKSKIDTSIIKASESESLSELISENTSVFVKSAGRGALATVSFRGTAASHTDVLWNGMSIKSPMLGEVDFSLIPMFLVDDVSLLHGGASIQQSSGALGGTIQIDNKPNWNNTFGLKFKQGLGSYKTINDFLQADIGNKKIQSKTRLFYTSSNNDFEFVNKNIADINPETGAYIYPTQKNKNANYLQYGWLQELYYRFAQKYSLSLKYWGQNSNRALPRLNTYEGDDYSNISKQDEQTHRIITHLERYGNKSKLDVSSGFIYSDMKYWMQNFVSGTGYHTVIYSNSQSQSSYNKLKYDYQLFKSTKLTASYELNYHNVLSKDTVKHEGYSQNRLENLLFLSWNQTITKRLFSVLMLRQNFIDKNRVPFIPYLGLDYLLNKKYQIIAKTSVSKNYRYPTLNDLYWQPGGNINLKPEQGWSADASIASQYDLGNINIESSATAFYSDIQDWILWLPSPMGYWSPQNVKHVVSKGIELHLKTNFTVKTIQFKINSNYAYTSSVNMDEKFGEDSYQKQLVYVPLHSFNLFAQMLWRGYWLSYQHNSFSERYTTSNNNSSQRDWLYPYFMNNLSLGKSLKIKKINIALNFKIYNLFDEEYRSVLGRPMPGRNYLISLSFKY